MLVISIVSMFALYGEAREQHRAFMPRYQDEFSYLIQARMIAHGRLWMPAHPLAEFFNSFQLLASPVYASIYFPGAAMFFTAGIILHLPFWVVPLMLSGFSCGLFFWVLTQFFDSVVGVLGTIMLISLPIFRLVTIMAMSQVPTLFLSLVMIVCWMQWQAARERRWIWAVLLGGASGWCAITRPLDALIAVIPISVAMLIDFYRRQSSRHGRDARDMGTRIVSRASRTCLEFHDKGSIAFPRTVGLLVLGASGFFALQLIFNAHVTGHYLQTPFSFFQPLCHPQSGYGFHTFDPTIRPIWDLPQVQKFYDASTVPVVENHTPLKTLSTWMNSRLPITILNGTPQVLLLILLGPAAAGLLQRRRWMLASLLPVFVVLYVPYAYFLTHYTVICAPGVIALILVGADVVIATFPARRATLTMFFTLAIAMLSISEFSLFNHSAWDEFFPATELKTIAELIQPIRDRGERAIVLFHVGPDEPGGVEPVYNPDVIWPDDAPVIRAHDRGEQNFKLFHYYAKQQPDRVVYRIDRAKSPEVLERLGRVDELSHRL